MIVRTQVLAILIFVSAFLVTGCPSTRQAGQDAVDMNCNPIALFSPYMLGQCLTGTMMVGVSEANRSAGTNTDDASVVARWKPAANCGDPDAQYALATAYRDRNPVQAYKWYNLAANTWGKRGEAQRYEHMQVQRDSLKAKMSPKELLEAEKLTNEWNSAGENCPPPMHGE